MIVTTIRAMDRSIRTKRPLLFLLAAGLWTQPALAAAPDTTSAREIVERMRSRYGGPRYESLTFVQRTIKYPEPGVADTTLWYEAILPGKLRIDTDLEQGNGALFVDGTRYSFKGGVLVDTAPDINPLALVLDEVYSAPVDRSVFLLDSLGFDLSVVREDRWEDEPAWVIGAGEGDDTSTQVWIEKERLLPVRLVTPLPQGPVLEARIGGYRNLSGSWVETEIVIHVNGKLYQTEEYTNVRVDVPLDEDLFVPEKWSERSRYWEGDAGS